MASDRSWVPGFWFWGARPVHGAALWSQSRWPCWQVAVGARAGVCGWKRVPGCGRLGKPLLGTASWWLRNYSSTCPARTVGTPSPALLCPLPRPCLSPFLLGGLRQATCPLLCVASRVGAGAPSPALGLWLLNQAPKVLEDAQAEGVVGGYSHTGRESWFQQRCWVWKGKA